MKFRKHQLIGLAVVLTVATSGSALALAQRDDYVDPVVTAQSEEVVEPVVGAEPVVETPTPQTPVTPEPEPIKPVEPVLKNKKPTLDEAKAKAAEAGQVSSFNDISGRAAVAAEHVKYGLSKHQTLCILNLHHNTLHLFKTVDLYKQTLAYVMEKYGDTCKAAEVYKSTGDY